MKRWIVLLLTTALLAGADAALAGGRGHGHFGRSPGAFIAVHPAARPIVRSAPFVHRPFVHRGGRVIVGSAIVVGAVGYPYYYAPPPYVPPAYVEEPPVSYIEQSDQVLYYCPDSRAYYPNVATCPSPWLKVVP
jgi:hypothetical protein